MSTTVVNIIAPGAAIGSAASGEAAAGPLGVFEAVMSAFFAGVDGSVVNPKGGSPFVADGPDPARHDLDASKLPARAHPVKVAAAAAAAGQPVGGEAGLLPLPGADIVADGLVKAAPQAVVAPPVEAAGSDPEAATIDGGAAIVDGEATAAAASDSVPIELAAITAQVQAAPVAFVDTRAAPEAEGGPAPPSVEAQPAPLPSEAADPPAKQADKDEKPKTAPGANASDAARLHAAPNSAVARAANLQAPTPVSPPAVEAPATALESPQPPSAPAELAAVETQRAPPEGRAPLAAPSRKSNEKPVRAEHAAPSGPPAPQDPKAGPTDAPASVEAPPTDKAPKHAAQTADAPRAQPAQTVQPDEATAATPAEPSPRAQAATHAGPAEAAQVRGSPETVASLSAQIVKKLGGRSTHFDVQLDPEGLGKVNVRVAINADGQVSAAMRFDNPQAAAELRSRAGELQRALAQSGFDLSGGLSFDVAQDQGGGHGGQQNAFFNDDNPGQAFRGRAFAAALETAGDAVQAALPGAFSPARGVAKGVDVRV